MWWGCRCGRRVRRRFAEATVLASVIRWLPADESEGEPMLFRVEHDDGDREDLEEDELRAALADFIADAPAMAAAVVSEEHAEAAWMAEGHALLGRRIARSFAAGVALGTITKWLPPDAANGEPPIFRAVHDDGDEEDLEEDEAEEAAHAFDVKAMDKESWQTKGPLVGKRILRCFGDAGAAKKRARTILGTIVRWLPPDAAHGEPPLWHAVHDDGDEEDLEQDEAEDAVSAFAAMPPRRSSERVRGA